MRSVDSVDKNGFTFAQRMDCRTATEGLIRKGLIKREPCPCGNPRAEAHHVDYGDPWNILWLCRQCHMRHHKLLRRGLAFVPTKRVAPTLPAPKAPPVAAPFSLRREADDAIAALRLPAWTTNHDPPVPINPNESAAAAVRRLIRPNRGSVATRVATIHVKQIHSRIWAERALKQSR